MSCRNCLLFSRVALYCMISLVASIMSLTLIPIRSVSLVDCVGMFRCRCYQLLRDQMIVWLAMDGSSWSAYFGKGR